MADLRIGKGPLNEKDPLQDEKMGSSLLIDTHAHLDLLDDPVKETLRAREKGIKYVVGVSMGKISARRIQKLADSMQGVILPALGLHPWNIDQEDSESCLSYIEENLDRAVALGEVGLDYRIRTPKSLQKAVLYRQLTMAVARDLAVILHCRFSHARVLEIVKEVGLRQAIFHWYSGPTEVLNELVKGGYFISATPAVKYSSKHREAISLVPLKNLVLETDCPVEYRGVESRPADVVEVCQQVASLKGVSFVEVAKVTTRNA
jgi:TatD DNase family protein